MKYIDCILFFCYFLFEILFLKVLFIEDDYNGI